MYIFIFHYVPCKVFSFVSMIYKYKYIYSVVWYIIIVQCVYTSLTHREIYYSFLYQYDLK